MIVCQLEDAPAIRAGALPWRPPRNRRRRGGALSGGRAQPPPRHPSLLRAQERASGRYVAPSTPSRIARNASRRRDRPMAPMQPVRREADRYEPRGIQCDQITAMAVRRASASCLSANAIAIGRTGCTCMASRHERPRANPRRGKGGSAHRQSTVSQLAALDGPPRRALARSAQVIGRLRKREASLLPLDRDGCSGCHPRALAREADLEWLIINSTIVRAHQQAAGARREKGADGPALS